MTRRQGVKVIAAITLVAFFTGKNALPEDSQPQLPDRTQQPPDKTLFTTFIKFAEFSAAAYADVDSIKRTCSSYGYELSDSGANLHDKVRYIIATNAAAKTQLIAVRGTANVENAIVDMDYELTKDKQLGIELHKGFSQSSRNIYQMVKSKVNKDFTIDITGHSLGGAAAVILAMYLDQRGYKIGQVITFGQPKVTDRAGAEKFQHLNVVRVNNLDDIIPTLPPFDASQIMSLTVEIFWPLGKEYVLLSGAYYSQVNGMKSLLRGIQFLGKKPGEENITAHKIDTYLQRLKNLQLRGHEIPFERRDEVLKPDNEEPTQSTGSQCGFNCSRDEPTIAAKNH